MLLDLLRSEISQEEYTRARNITILYRKLPKYMHGFVYGHNRNYIFINSNLGERNKSLALLHEFAHVELHHLETQYFKCKVADIEDEADRYVEMLLKITEEEKEYIEKC